MRRLIPKLFHYKNSVLRRTTPSLFQPAGTCRHLMKYLNFIPNAPDPSRTSKVGPDAACAEWILKLGGAVRFEGDKEWIRNYNFLPSVMNPDYKPGLVLDEIDGSGTSVMWVGFLISEGHLSAR
uniref:ATP synthase subunit s, mitochondrial n=1 Tax=Pinctada fucata TaxID=50426 RepID=A0A194AKW7_PINFU